MPKFPVFGKVEVNGLNEEPLFSYLKVVCLHRITFLVIWYMLSVRSTAVTVVISCSPQELLPFVNPVIGDIKKLYWSPIKVNDIRWNFEKFLITADGRPFKR